MGRLVTIEKWSENLEEVTLSRWLKAEGDCAGPGDLLCEIITDKVTFEYQLDEPSVVLRLLCPEQSVLPVGYALAFLGEPGEPLPAEVESANAALLEAHARRAILDLDLALSPPVPAAAPVGGPVRATPAARRLARERGAAVEDVSAWRGGEGAVTESDVVAYLAR